MQMALSIGSWKVTGSSDLSALRSEVCCVLQGLYDIGYGTVLDSGTTFTYLPSQAFDQIHSHVSDYALALGLQTIPGPDANFDDSCFGGAPSADHPEELQKVFPTLEFQFEVRHALHAALHLGN